MTNSPHGLGWPEGSVTAVASGGPGGETDHRDHTPRDVGTAHRMRAAASGVPDLLTAPGLGWPGEGVADLGRRAAGTDDLGHFAAPGGLGSEIADGAAGTRELAHGGEEPGAAEEKDTDQGESSGGAGPHRVRRVLARVSRETPPPPTPMDGARDAQADSLAGEWRDGVGGLVREREVPVAVPVTPTASADTPIARAAQAAVVARSGGEAWPRPSSCRVITIANQKGGVGKTTTAVNLAAALAMHGCRVLVVDLDPQGNASTALDVEHRSGVASVYDVLVDDRPLASVIQPVAGFAQLYCAPAAIDLAGAEIELVPQVARESRLARALASYDASNLDYIFIDCPPSLGLLTVNALVAAPEVLIPIQCEYYALEGLEQLLRTIELVRSHLNQGLSVTTILLTMYDGRTRLASQVADEVRDHFGSIVLTSIIPRSVRVSEAPSYGQSVMTYDPGSSGAVAYMEAAREVAARSVQLPA
jgi:chromosome partitioning protein